MTRASDRPSRCGGLSIRLAGGGRRGEGLTAIEDAVEMRRELAAGNRDAHLPDLVGSLRVQARIRQQLGDTDAADALSAEADSLDS